MKTHVKSFLGLLLLFIAFNTTNAQITGTVFRDVNGNGAIDVNPIEPGISGIVVNIYNTADILAGTTTSSLTGTYSVTPTGVGPFRLEFITPAALNFLNASASGNIYGTSVRFVSTAAQANVHFALHQSGNFASNTNPSIVVSRMLEGASTGAFTAQPVILKAKYLSTGNTVTAASFALPTGATQLATMAQVGTIYGIATQNSKGKIYAGAYQKRYTGFGPGGPAAIYQIDTAGTGSITGTINLSTLTGVANVAGTDPHDFTARARAGGGTEVYDLGPSGVGFTSFTGVGTMSLGDVEISGDEKTLYTVNLLTKQIYALDVSTGVAASTTLQFTWAAPDATTASRHRPFGLKWNKGLLYIGSVDENGTNAYVHSFDPNSASPTFTLQLTVPLGYNRQSFIGPANNPLSRSNWNAWATNPTTVTFLNQVSENEIGFPQAILSGIQFDALDNMVLGFRDRWGDQTGYTKRFITTSTINTYGTTAGDILKACINAAGTGWLVEANAACATANGLVNSGPGGATSPEHYEWDFFQEAPGSPAWNSTIVSGGLHWEITQGGLAQLPGSAVVLTTSMDPMNDFSSGLLRLTNSDGRREGITINTSAAVPITGGYTVTETGNFTAGYPAANGSFGKANGMGDLELLGILAPIEIGNRVWNDTNGDGIQNPDEAGIANVILELTNANGTAVDSDPATAGIQPTFVTTDANGNWYLTSATGVDATGTNYGVALLTNTNYVVKLATTGAGNDWDPTANGGAGGPRVGGNLVGFQLTKTDAIGNGAVNLSDNDATTIASIPQISVTTGVNGENNHSLDFGFKTLASLGNRVWLDEGAGGGTAKNGVQDGTEPGIAGVAVNLYQNGLDGLPGTDDDVLVGSTLTDAFGNYLFENLTPSAGATTQYNVRVSPPANYSLTTQTNTTDDNNTTGASTTGSDVNALGVSYAVNLASGENNPNIDAGLVFNTPTPPNSIGDKVWLDANGNGVNDGGVAEPGVAGVTVTLYNAAGDVVAVTTTDANGNYLFNNLPANTNFTVGFSAPAGTVLSPNVGGTTIGNGTTNSDPNPTTGLTTTINTGAAGTQITGIDAGLINDPKGAIGDYVWNDLDRDGIQDAGEPGVAGVTMRLYGPGVDGVVGGGDDVLLVTITTDSKGYYVFPNLDPDKYFVVATPVAGYTRTLENVTAANPGGDTKDSDFLSGTGTYAASYVSPLYTLLPTAGGVTRDMTIDLGIYSNAPVNTLNTLGDKVWNDVDKDGIQDAGEAGVANVTVRLLTSAGLPVNNPATGKPYVVTTDANGNYKFVDLPDGNYIVEFANLPAGYSFTGQDKDAANAGAPGSATDGTTDSDAKTTTGRTAVISVDAASASATSVNIINVDAGISQGIEAGLASLGNRVWYDLNNNGLQDAGELGVNNVKVELLDAAGNPVNAPGTALPYVVRTNALGEYMFTGLPAGDYTVRFSQLPAGFTSSAANVGANANDETDADATFGGASVTATTTATTGIYILQTGEENTTVDMGIVPAAGTNSVGNFVWSDTDADGIQDAGELGTQGVMVKLYGNGADGLPGTADDVVVGTTVTDKNGAYSFVGLPDGNYNVGFENLPAGFSFTDPNAAGSTAANGSDASKANGRTGTIALDPTSASGTGLNNPDVDAGIITTRAALGNYVWYDADADGIQDAGEKPVVGATVTLYASDATTVLASTVTDATGYYFFPNLLAGDYVVGFSTIPSNTEFTQQNTPGDNGNNTNSDTNPITGLSSVITLVAGEVDATIDAGIKPTLTASVGDKVWLDKNGDGLQGADEAGVPGVLVTLKDNLGNVVGTAITDGDGNYRIDGIKPGTDFTITFSKLPAGATFTIQTSDVSTTDATLGSDANASGVTAAFNLVAGQYLPHVDAGLINILLLPLKIESFTALPRGSQVNLQWTVSEQINVANYEVLTSTDGRTFTTIATVAANTNSNANYDALHNTPAAGINYYRIKSIDKDGTISYSDIRKVTFGKGGTVTVYPNPAVDVVNISLTGSMVNKVAIVSIISMDGKLLSQQRIANTGQKETIDVSTLSNGAYILRLIADAEVVNKTIQVIK